MYQLFTYYLLGVALLSVLITAMFIPRAPVIALVSASAIALAGGVWWHWTQFSVEYRTSTWQEHLRNYSSYILLFVIIVCSYLFYVVSFKSDIKINTENITSMTTQAMNAVSDVLFTEDEGEEEGEEEEEEEEDEDQGERVNQNKNKNRNQNRNRNQFQNQNKNRVQNIFRNGNKQQNFLV